MSSSRKIFNLALQGGGSHGAFTWGVLDRILEEEDRLQIEGISGTSAGALNGAVLVEGHAKGGAAGARQALERFWQGVGKLATFEFPQRTLLDRMLGNWNMDQTPGAMAFDAWQRMISPYQSNPLNINPLRHLVESLIDIEAVRSCKTIKLFVSATNVERGRVRIFDHKSMTIDALMASACLPFAFQAVMIDGAPYWDGGYVGNPSIFPLIYHCKSPDVAVVQVNPTIRPGVPDTPTEIINRLNEITFNASLIGEMRAIAFVQHLIDEGHLKDTEARRLKRMNMHVIGDEDEMRKLGATSKLNAHMDFLLHLKEIGRAAADRWLKANWSAIGEHSSIDIKTMFL